jgi:hypothetical protein
MSVIALQYRRTVAIQALQRDLVSEAPMAVLTIPANRSLQDFYKCWTFRGHFPGAASVISV